MILFKQKLKVMSACVALVFWADPVLAEQATSHSPATMWGTDTFDGVMHGHWFDHVALALNFAYEYSLKEEKVWTIFCKSYSFRGDYRGNTGLPHDCTTPCS